MLFGLLTFFLPGITLVTLVLLFGAYTLVDGIFNLIAFLRVTSHQWTLLIEGLIGIHRGSAYLCLAGHHRDRLTVRDRVLGDPYGDL